MTDLPTQLAFIRQIHGAMLRTDLRRVASGEMTEAESQRRDEIMSSVVATLERQLWLSEVSEEMKKGMVNKV